MYETSAIRLASLLAVGAQRSVRNPAFLSSPSMDDIRQISEGTQPNAMGTTVHVQPHSSDATTAAVDGRFVQQQI